MIERSYEYNLVDYDLIANKICDKGMGEVLLFLMESHKPLVNITKQIILAFHPFLNFFVKKNELNIFLSVFDNSKNFTNFMNCLSKILESKNN